MEESDQAPEAVAGPSRLPEPSANGHAVVYHEVNEEQNRTDENNGNNDDGSGGHGNDNGQGVGNDPRDDGDAPGDDEHEDNSAAHSLLFHEGASSSWWYDQVLCLKLFLFDSVTNLINSVKSCHPTAAFSYWAQRCGGHSNIILYVQSWPNEQ